MAILGDADALPEHSCQSLCLRPNELVLGDKFGEFLSLNIKIDWDPSEAARLLGRPGPFPARLEMTVSIHDQGEDLKVFATEDAARAWIEENDPV
jgi:hypothetical protein